MQLSFPSALKWGQKLSQLVFPRQGERAAFQDIPLGWDNSSKNLQCPLNNPVDVRNPLPTVQTNVRFGRRTLPPGTPEQEKDDIKQPGMEKKSLRGTSLLGVLEKKRDRFGSPPLPPSTHLETEASSLRQKASPFLSKARQARLAASIRG